MLCEICNINPGYWTHHADYFGGLARYSITVIYCFECGPLSRHFINQKASKKRQERLNDLADGLRKDNPIIIANFRNKYLSAKSLDQEEHPYDEWLKNNFEEEFIYKLLDIRCDKCNKELSLAYHKDGKLFCHYCIRIVSTS